MLTQQDEKWHKIYEGLPPELMDHVSEAFIGAREYLNENFLKTFGDDRAEMLIAAIARYVVDCGNNEPED